MTLHHSTHTGAKVCLDMAFRNPGRMGRTSTLPDTIRY